MRKAIAAAAVAAMLACTLGLAACSGGSSGESSDGGSSEEAAEEATEEDLTEEEVYEWYEDNFYGQTLTGTISGVYDDDEYFGEDGEVVASYVYCSVALDEPIERGSEAIDGMSMYYFDYDVLSGYGVEFIDYDEDDDSLLWWTYDDDTSFAYADGTAAAVEDLAAGDAVTITFGDRGEIVEVVIGQ